ncbi:hypothetical protein EBZ35_05120 [bacterium]|nr:hypothetical protein [bacterium]
MWVWPIIPKGQLSGLIRWIGSFQVLLGIGCLMGCHDPCDEGDRACPICSTTSDFHICLTHFFGRWVW